MSDGAIKDDLLDSEPLEIGDPDAIKIENDEENENTPPVSEPTPEPEDDDEEDISLVPESEDEEDDEEESTTPVSAPASSPASDSEDDDDENTFTIPEPEDDDEDISLVPESEDEGNPPAAEGGGERPPVSPEHQEKIDFVNRLISDVHNNEEARMEAKYGRGRTRRIRRWFATTSQGKWTKVGLKVAGGSAAMLASAVTGGGAMLVAGPILYTLGMKTTIDGVIEGVQEAVKGGRRRTEIARAKGQLDGMLMETMRRAREEHERLTADDIERVIREVASAEEAIINQENNRIREERRESLIRNIASTVLTAGTTFFTGMPVGVQDFDKVGSAAEYAKLHISGVDAGGHHVGASVRDVLASKQEVFHFLYKIGETPTASAASHIGGMFKSHIAGLDHVSNAQALVASVRRGVTVAYGALLGAAALSHIARGRNRDNPDNVPTIQCFNENPDSPLRARLDGIRQRENEDHFVWTDNLDDDDDPEGDDDGPEKPDDPNGGGGPGVGGPDEGAGGSSPENPNLTPSTEAPEGSAPAPETAPVTGSESAAEKAEKAAIEDAEDIVKILGAISEGSDTLAQNIVVYGLKKSANPEAVKNILRKELDPDTPSVLSIELGDYAREILSKYFATLDFASGGEKEAGAEKATEIEKENIGPDRQSNPNEDSVEAVGSVAQSEVPQDEGDLPPVEDSEPVVTETAQGVEITSRAEKLAEYMAQKVLKAIDSDADEKFINDVIETGLEEAGVDRAGVEKILKGEVDSNRRIDAITKVAMRPREKGWLRRYFFGAPEAIPDTTVESAPETVEPQSVENEGDEAEITEFARDKVVGLLSKVDDFVSPEIVAGVISTSLGKAGENRPAVEKLLKDATNPGRDPNIVERIKIPDGARERLRRYFWPTPEEAKKEE